MSTQKQTPEAPSPAPADLFGREWGCRLLAQGRIGGLCDLAEHVGTDIREGDTPQTVIARICKYVYRDTRCGCSVDFLPVESGAWCDRVVIQGQCEGVTWEFHRFLFGFGDPIEIWDASLSAADDEGVDAWNLTHGCEGCGEPGEIGYRKVREDCPNCGGRGVVL